MTLSFENMSFSLIFRSFRVSGVMVRTCNVLHMACRVVRMLSTYSKSNTLAEAGAIERQLCTRLFINFCHKNDDISFDFPEISMRVVVNGDRYYNFMHAKREVWENYVAKD